ncbi:hypothetical protein Tco_1279977, partial [Tanacetum coccineum]
DTSPDFHSDAPPGSSSDSLSDSSSGHFSLRHSSPARSVSERPSHSSSEGPSRKSCRSLTDSVSSATPTPGALFPADIDACIAVVDAVAAWEMDVRVEVGVETKDEAKEEAESSARGTVKIGVDRVTHPVVSDDIVEPVKEDFPELVSVDGSLEVMQR